MNSRKEARSKKKQARQGLPRFFTKQLLAFMLLAFAIMVIDFFLYTFIALYESNESYSNGTPITTVRAVDSGLSEQEGVYELSPKAAETLEERQAWAFLLNEEGAAVWEYKIPAEVARTYTTTAIALAAHYGNIENYPVFFWDRPEGLLAVGFPKGSFWHMAVTLPESSVRNLPSYILLIFAVDLGILFLAYFVSRRRTQRNVAPIVDSLDNISKGRPAALALKGDLREIGEKITDTSAIIDRKDTARINWIRGVSHDIRTPLSMILGYADAIAQSKESPDQARNQAHVIRTQGFKIKDLVDDLNAASQLDYDMQPLNLERIHVPRLVRNIVAAHANSGLGDAYPIELSVASNATEAQALADERLLTRALENVLTNARLHNEEGCAIRVDISLDQAPLNKHAAPPLPDRRRATITITDDGKGISASDLNALELRISRARQETSSTETLPHTEHGLGLVLVDRIMRAHGGSLSIEQTPPSGLMLHLQLPLA